VSYLIHIGSFVCVIQCCESSDQNRSLIKEEIDSFEVIVDHLNPKLSQLEFWDNRDRRLCYA